MKTRRPPLAQLVREQLAPLGRGRRTLGLIRLVALSGFTAAPLWMTGTIILRLCGTVAGVTYPLGYRMMINGALSKDAGTTVAGAGVTAGIFALSWALSIIGATQSAGLTDRVNLWLSTKVGRLLAEAPSLEHFEQPDYMAEVDLLTQNRRALAGSPRLALNLILTFAQTVAVAIILAGIYPLLAILPVIGLAPLLGDDATVRIQERATQRMAEQTRLAGELYATLTTAESANELRVCGAQEELRRRFDTLARQIQRATTLAALRGLAFSAAGWLLYAVLFGGAIALLAVQAANGHASVGDVVMAIALIRRVQSQVGSVSDAFGQIITNSRTALRLLWLETLVEREIPRHRDARPAKPPAALTRGITLDDVSFTYPGTDRVALRNVSLFLPAGATVAIVGENGAGKSTLVKLLQRLYEPTSGRILVDGTDLSEFDHADWRARCTATFQDFVRFELPARHIVGVGDLKRMDEEDAVLAALDVAQGREVVESLNEGLDTPVGRTFPTGRDLSGGQWQRLALARGAMPQHPLVAALDEPTASVDAQAEANLFTRMARLAHKATATGAITIFISHRFPSARIADLIVVLDEGRTAEVGDHESLLAQGGLYAEMFALQARAYQ